MRKTRFRNPLTLFLLLLIAIMLVPSAMMMDDDGQEDGDPGPAPRCFETTVGQEGSPYLNGLPLLQENLEIVGDTFMVNVQIPPFCDIVTPGSLPFRWEVSGPSGPVTLTAANTLRPRFRPTVAGTYEGNLTYCPQTCRKVDVESNIVDIPPQQAPFKFVIVNELPLPPDTEPELNALALNEFPLPPDTDPELKALASGGIICVDSSGATVECVDTDLLKRQTKCGRRNSSFGPQLVPVHPWVNQRSYQLVEGKVMVSKIAGFDAEINHTSHDAIANVLPDPLYARLKVPAKDGVEKETMEVEWESNSFPGPMRPMPGDRISAFGFHTYDCHHHDDRFGILAEIHPAVLTAVHRRRPIQVPDGWEGLGNNIHVPGIITDIWANKRAGEMTSNCSTSGMHQAAINDDVDGACIRSPHPFDRKFTFNIYLPPNPQKRLAEAGVSAPPAPLYLNIERAPAGAERPDVQVVAAGGVTSLLVTVDLTNYTAEEYSARIVAGWVQPGPDNWGLERYKMGITAIDIRDDHDPVWGDDGDWVFWAAINNRDKEWTRLLDGGDVTGFHNFGGRPFETESRDADRSLGSHLLLFNPRPVDFPGYTADDLNRSYLIHTSGYDAELWDDETGVVNQLQRPFPNVPVGSPQRAVIFSSTGDYRLHFFVERLGPVPPNLSAAGKALASVYTVRPKEAHCPPVSTTACILFPERSVAKAWHPVQARLRPGDANLAWRNFPIFKRQEPEELGFTGISARELKASLVRERGSDPKRVEQFMVELRQEFDAVRGTRMEREFAKALPVLKANIPADLWQRHFADIDPTPVGRSRRWLWAAIIIILAIIASTAFWFFRRPRARIA